MVGDNVIPLTHNMSGCYGVFTSYNSRYTAHVLQTFAQIDLWSTSYIGKRWLQKIRAKTIIKAVGMWIKTSERMPEIKVKCIIFVDGAGVLDSPYYLRAEDKWCSQLYQNEFTGRGKVTHWIPWPEPPTAEQGEGANLQTISSSMAQIAARIESVSASIQCGDPIAIRKILDQCVRQLRHTA